MSQGAKAIKFSVRKQRRARYDWYLVSGKHKLGFVNPVGRQGWHWDVAGVTAIASTLALAIEAAKKEMSK